MSHFDVVIVGAGLSGIGSACHLQDKCPGKTFVLLEGRNALGGTWDLFRYPGVRSDSDMHTLGYNFKPWRAAEAIADGPSILSYVREAAEERGVVDHIRYGHKVVAAHWSTDDAQWTVDAQCGEERVAFTCTMLLMCGGYYNYDEPHDPAIAGLERFEGTVVHPQFWPEDLDYAGKKVVVIGSGATAMTLVPAMAENGAEVTMVQRSPTYVVSMPAVDADANRLRRFLPEDMAYKVTRWKNVRNDVGFYRRTRTEPEKVKFELLYMVREALGPDYDVKTHFTPRYNPWDQRLCLIPDDDLYNAINAGTASVETDEIESVTKTGLVLKSGKELDADIIVTATGLKLIVASGVAFDVDGEPVDFPQTYSYKGMMYSDMPNMVQTFGYINASWTLRSDLTAEFVCRLINRMDKLGMRQVTPRLREQDKTMKALPWIDDFSAGYMQRLMHLFPKQGDWDPWRHTQDFAEDKKLIRDAPIDDDVLAFTNPIADGRVATGDTTASSETAAAR
ncbi:MAG: NAD(P)/FAD-dependent oxidoreductase [Pseudomonadota bacterium]